MSENVRTGFGSRFLSRYGAGPVIQTVFFPLISCFTGPVRLLQTLWNCRVLLKGNWADYNRFTPNNGINSLTYWTSALNLHRYGRFGKSPYVGMGNYDLSWWFFYPLPSLFLYWHASTITILVSMTVWLASFSCWFLVGAPGWTALVIGMAACSTLFFSSTFVSQNYNVVGWCFLPLGVFGLLHHEYMLSGACWFMMSFGSPTAVFFAGFISCAVAVGEWSFFPLLTLLPACVKLLTHFIPMLKGKSLSQGIMHVLKCLGVLKRDTKYVRKTSHALRVLYLYHFALYIQFQIMTILQGGQYWFVFLVAPFALAVNLVIRFADLQSVLLAGFTLATILLLKEPGLPLLLSYWLLVSPIPVLSGIPVVYTKKIDIIPTLRPFHIRPLLEKMDVFLSNVERGSRILMCFRDPHGIYQRIYDGHRVFVELICYCAARAHIHVVPDWWAIYETNSPGTPDFWGRESVSVVRNVEKCHAGYVLMYSDSNTGLEKEWEEKGFVPVGRLPSDAFDEHLSGVKPWKEQCDWYLLRTPGWPSNPEQKPLREGVKRDREQENGFIQVDYTTLTHNEKLTPTEVTRK